MALILPTVKACLLHNLVRLKAYSELSDYLLFACHINKWGIFLFISWH